MVERDGLVVNISEPGARVRQRNRQEVIDNSQMRKFHEWLACQRCAEWGTPASTKAIEEIHEDFVVSALSNDIDTNLQADIALISLLFTVRTAPTSSGSSKISPSCSAG